MMRHAQLADLLHHVLAESVFVGEPGSGLVDALVDSAADVLQK